MHQILLPFLLIFYQEVLAKKEAKSILTKPDFAPYCIAKDICWPDCQCTSTENCEIIPLSKHTKEKILMILNQKRQIQTRGEAIPSGMNMLIYDHQLEQVSECWAAKCENTYSECFRTEIFEETSQAVGQITLDENIDPLPNHWIRIVDNWFGEFTSLSFEIIGSLPQGDFVEKIHNFAQLSSDKVLNVGCAWSLSGNKITFVCTFGPRGPISGEPVYKIGELCTECFIGYKCNYEKPFENLCKKIDINNTSEETTTMEVTTSESIIKATVFEENNDTKPMSRLSRATIIDPEDEKNFNILWIFALGLILLILVVLIIFALFYVLRLGVAASC